MTQMPADAVHPNLARLAAAYDGILEQMDRGQLSPVQARAKISQLEARDDQGVRWSIDPDTGQYVRKTAFGDVEFDAPPKWGVRTEDAFAYTTNPLVENPNGRLQHVQLPQMLTPPTGLAGATQRQPAPRRAGGPASVALDAVATLPGKVKVGLLVAAVAVLAMLFVNAAPDDGAQPAPVPAPTSVPVVTTTS